VVGGGDRPHTGEQGGNNNDMSTLKEFIELVEAQEAAGEQVICIPVAAIQTAKSLAIGTLRGGQARAGGRKIVHHTPAAEANRERVRRHRAGKKDKESG
jgi:hypothetical protein